MAERLKEVIERIKANQLNSLNAQQKQVDKPISPPKLDEDMDDEFTDDGEVLEEKDEKPQPVKEQHQEKQVDSISRDIEMLQNNGRFRIELLHQLNEINKALVVIAGTMADLTGNGKSTR